MKLEVKIRQPKFYDHIMKVLDEDFLSHAYLIETNNNKMDIVSDYIHFFVKKIYEYSYKKDNVTIDKDKLFHLLDNKEFPDYIEIIPSANQIKKEQILDIIKEFFNKSLYGTPKIYTIYDCDLMNNSAANTILKFLEEPSDDVIAIFVTSNQYKVIDTIRSRCQIISLQHEESDMGEISESLKKFLEGILKRQEHDLLLDFNYYLSNLFQNKKMAVETVKTSLDYYRGLLNRMEDKEKCKLSLIELITIISILDEALNRLKYNVNIKLWLDNLLLSLMEVLN